MKWDRVVGTPNMLVRHCNQWDPLSLMFMRTELEFLFSAVNLPSPLVNLRMESWSYKYQTKTTSWSEFLNLKTSEGAEKGKACEMTICAVQPRTGRHTRRTMLYVSQIGCLDNHDVHPLPRDQSLHMSIYSIRLSTLVQLWKVAKHRGTVLFEATIKGNKVVLNFETGYKSVFNF